MGFFINLFDRNFLFIGDFLTVLILRRYLYNLAIKLADFNSNGAP